jgi:hypothetical protein
LSNEWPEYAKPMARVDLLRRLDLPALVRAAAVEPGLANMLRRIGLLA